MSSILKKADPERSKRANKTSIVGILVNFFLAAAKVTAGLITGLVSLVADGVNNISDMGSGVVSLVSFKIAEKPADEEHPYGHHRAEYVATMLIAFFVLLLAVELFRESIGKIIENTATDAATLIVVLPLVISLAAKAFLFGYYRAVGKQINSDALKAASVDSACDCLSTTAVLIGYLISLAAPNVPADGIAGLLVALFIVWQGVSLLKDTSSKLLGKAVEPECLDEIKQMILSHEGVLGLHDLHVYVYGPDKFFASVHIEVDANVPVLEAHELVDSIEREFAEQTTVLLTGHLDPIVTSDNKTNMLREQIGCILRDISPEIGMHDFRVVWGEKRTNVLFDVAVPFSCKIEVGELKETLEKQIRLLGSYEPIITVERE